MYKATIEDGLTAKQGTANAKESVLFGQASGYDGTGAMAQQWNYSTQNHISIYDYDQYTDDNKNNNNDRVFTSTTTLLFVLTCDRRMSNGYDDGSSMCVGRMNDKGWIQIRVMINYNKIFAFMHALNVFT